MTQRTKSVSDSEPARVRGMREGDALDLPGGFVSEGDLPSAPDPVEIDGLSGFPSEAQPPPPPATPRVISPIVRPSAIDRERFMDRPRSIHFALKRLERAINPALGLLAVALIVVSIIRDQSITSIRDSESVEPMAVSGAPPPAFAGPAREASLSAPAAMAPPPEARPSDVVVDAARNTDEPLPKPSKPPSRPRQPPPALALTTTRPSVPNWAMASAQVRPLSSSSLPISTYSVATDVAPPATLPPATLPPAPPPPTPTPAVSSASTTSGTSVAAARTASVRSVIDRYRDAFDSLDASAVPGFWPSVDSRALGRAFAQLDSQRLHFDRCDIQLAGARAFASCHGYAQLVRKAGSQDPRFEQRQWTFTFGEVNDHWVILGVDARQER